MMPVPVLDHPKEVISFVEMGLWGGRRNFGPATGIGFATAEEGLVAGFVYHNFEPDNGLIEISAFSQRRDWLTRKSLRVVFDFPFGELECRAVVARHSEHNNRSIRIWHALGAEQTVVPNLRADGEAEVIALLSAKTWQASKFKEVTHG